MGITIKTRHLVHCRVLAEHGNYGRAAESLGITQPALTRSIQGLERLLGVTLFDRGRGSVRPTDFGRVLVERGRLILVESEELERELKLMQGLDVGELNLSVGLYPAELSAHLAVGRLLRHHPKIRCRIRLCDWRRAAEDVLNGEADLAVADTRAAEDEPRLATKLLGEHPLKLFCRPGHPLSGRRGLGIDDVFSYPWVCSRAPASVTRLLPKDTGEAGWVDPKTGDFVFSIQVDNLTAAKQVVSESDAIGVAPTSMIEEELGTGALAVLDFQETWTHLNYGFIHLRDRTLSPATIAFMEEIEAVEADLAARR
jgi:DNA-binding transcriptional LysR family regulator